jgi:TrmH family RNA methyltransferase
MTAEELKAMAQRAGRRAVPAGPGHEAVARAMAVARGREPGRMLAEGLWLNAQALEYGADIEALYVCPELIYTDEWADTAARLAARSAGVYAVSEKVYGKISAEKADAGLLSVIRLPAWRLGDIPERGAGTVLVLDGLENPGNVGTLIRTAEGAGADAVVLTDCRTGLNHRMAVRASLCTLLAMPVLEAPAEEAAACLAARGYTVYLGRAESAARYCDVDWAARSAIVVGHEKYGVGGVWLGHPHVGVGIPMRGRVDSLNVAVAGGILLYEAGRKRRLF